MRILVATDAWQPQLNGVVSTLTALARAVQARGARLEFLTPEGFPTFSVPGYSSVRVAIPSPAAIARRISAISPDAIHIATEGPIGWLVRRYCRAHRLPFTTSFHTRFPDYASARLPIPDSWVWRSLRRFHNTAAAVMTATPTLVSELEERGFRNVVLWPLGVDTELFSPRSRMELGFPRPLFLTVGRLAIEKNLEAFLSLDLPGTKLVVGDGPLRGDLARRYPDAVFLGARQGGELAAIYASADVFVFPSRTDTFGLVLLEALASGVPVAALPSQAPRYVIGAAPVGVMREDLQAACLRALTLSRAACRSYALQVTWEDSARSFLANVRRLVAAPVAGTDVEAIIDAPAAHRHDSALAPRSLDLLGNRLEQV
jgi:glycosyltransferase involved in cell wall biosynthesis